MEENLRLYVFFETESEELLDKGLKTFLTLKSEMVKNGQVEDIARYIQDIEKKSINFILMFKNEIAMRKFGSEQREKFEIDFMRPFDEKEEKVIVKTIVGELETV